MLRLAAMRSWFVCILICMFAMDPAAASHPASSDTISRLILRLQDDTHAQHASGQGQGVEARLNGILSSMHITGVALERSVDTSLVVLRFSDSLSADQIAEITDRLNNAAEVLYAVPDGRVRPAYVPNDSLTKLTWQWYHYDSYGIRAYDAWDLERGDPGVVIALLDTGIRPHEDLDPARILPGYDFISDLATANDGNGRDSDPTDPGDAQATGECSSDPKAEPSSWHGLQMAGIMIASADNGIGIAGINHFSRLLPVRVLGKCGGSFSDIIDAILWSAGLPVNGVPVNATPAKVINLSFSGLGTCNAAIQDAIDRAVAAGSVVVAAAGNEDGTDVAGVLPAGCNNVITVAATTRAGSVGAYSNVGSRVLLSAPGGDGASGPSENQIYSLDNSGLSAPGADTYAFGYGTSSATAEVSAAVSLLISAHPQLTADEVRQILSQTARPYSGGCPTSVPCGAGILDLYAAVQMAQSTTPSGSAAPTTSSGGGGGGGGGGGCVLQRDEEPDLDGAWLVLLLFLGGLGVWRHTTRV